MTISEEEDRIFASWTARRPNLKLIRDGVVNEDAYSSSNPRVLFLLKEPNTTETDWSLIDFIRRGAQSSTWDNLSRWVIGIRHLEKDIPWKEISSISLDQRVDALKSAAVMNLKKSPGRRVANEQELSNFASEENEFLIEQFSLYNNHESTHVSVCCGSIIAQLFYSILVADKSLSWKTAFNGVSYLEYQPRKFAIAYAHPEARVADNILYYPLIDAVKEILLKKGGHQG